MLPARPSDASRPAKVPRPAKTSRPARASSGSTGGHEAPTAVGRPAQERDLRAQGKKTMGKLHDAALEVFSKRGYHAARVDDIVRVAKTSHGTFYLYFANKEDLFRSLVANVVEEMTAVAASLGPVGPGPEGYEEVRSWLMRFSDLYDRHGPILRAWTEAEAYDAEFGRLGTREASRFTEVLARRLDESGQSVIPPAVAAVAVTAMVERFNYYRVSRGLEVDPELAIEAMARMIHTGCFGAGAGAAAGAAG